MTFDEANPKAEPVDIPTLVQVNGKNPIMRIEWSSSCHMEYSVAAIMAVDRAARKKGMQTTIRGTGLGVEVFEVPLEKKPRKKK